VIRVGINTMAWGDTVDAELLARLPWLREIGYDGVEVPILDPAGFDAIGAGDAIRAAGLGCTASTALPAGASLVDPAGVPAGLAFLRACLDAGASAGATVLCGPLFAPVGQHRHRPTAAERDTFVAAMRELAPEAAARGVRLAVEPLNRFETGFLNTVADGLDLVGRVGHPAVGLLLDTFHMNVEERDPVAALRSALPHLAHVHFSCNDRGPVGTGHLPWEALAGVLTGGGYDGWVTCETFAGHIPQLAQATAIWRDLSGGPEAYATASVAAARSWFPAS
jgi:D-psicose/D-tagatose/L-ribulose 3-epimerase